MATENRQRRAGQKTGGMKPFYILLLVVAVAGAGLIGMSVMKKSSAATAARADMTPVANSAELLQKARGVTRGNPNAPVKLMVFSDYMCPWCGVYATTIANQVQTEFIDSGKAVEIYYDFPLGGSHIHSFLAARAARCAEDQNKFWEYHDVLFSKQRDWSFEQSAPTEMFNDFAGEVGLDGKKFSACLESDAHADLVEYNRQLGAEAGVNSTPTVFVNGRASAAPLDWEKFKAEIEAAIPAGR